jgi:hypothetical protein
MFELELVRISNHEFEFKHKIRATEKAKLERPGPILPTRSGSKVAAFASHHIDTLMALAACRHCGGCGLGTSIWMVGSFISAHGTVLGGYS